MSYQKKTAIFNKCAQAYHILSGDHRDICICPLCGNGFIREAIDEKILTLEHIPPQSLGGRDILLTCVNCNNRSGYKLDAELVKRQSHYNLITALTTKTIEFSGRVKLEIVGEKLNFDLSIDSQGGRISYKPAGNNPKAMERYRKKMKELASENILNGQQFKTTTVFKYNDWLSKVADLRLAYLASFALFGYRYAFDNRLSKIREQIQNPEKRILNGFWTFHNFDLKEMFIVLADEPITMLLAVLGGTMVFLPWVNGPKDPFKEFSSMYPKGEVINYSGKKFLWPDRVYLSLDFLLKNS